MLDSMINLLQSMGISQQGIQHLLSPVGSSSPPAAPQEGASADGQPVTQSQPTDLTDLLAQSAAKTPGKGMDDDVPAKIDGKTPAALSQGEFVIPADVVALLGDGHSNAGSKVLEELLDKIRKLKTGSEEQPKSLVDLLQGDK